MNLRGSLLYTHLFVYFSTKLIKHLKFLKITAAVTVYDNQNLLFMLGSKLILTSQKKENTSKTDQTICNRFLFSLKTMTVKLETVDRAEFVCY